MQEESMRTINQVKKLINEDSVYENAVYLRPKQGMERCIKGGHDVHLSKRNTKRWTRCPPDGGIKMLRFLLKMIVGIIQIPLTLVYFIFNFLGGIFSGIGCIAGIVVFISTGVCWLFGQFNAWYQPLIGIGIAGGLAFIPVFVTYTGGDMILKLKELINMV